MIDANVTCRQLGFVGGNFTYHSFSRNQTEYMMFKKPACRGHENSLFECIGKDAISVGTHICGKILENVCINRISKMVLDQIHK